MHLRCRELLRKIYPRVLRERTVIVRLHLSNATLVHVCVRIRESDLFQVKNSN